MGVFSPYKVGRSACFFGKEYHFLAIMTHLRSLVHMFLSLPDHVIAELLLAWLPIQELGRLDSAICMKVYRDHFLRAAYEQEATYKYLSHRSPFARTTGDVCVDWILMRGISTDAIAVAHKFVAEDEMRQAHLRRHGTKIRTVLFPYEDDPLPELICMKALNDLCAYCPNVTELVCPLELSDSAFDLIGRAWPLLEVIEFRDDDPQFEACVRMLQQRCTALKSVTISLDLAGWSAFLDSGGSKLEQIRGSLEDTNASGAFHECIARCCPKLRLLEVEHPNPSFPTNVQALAQGCPLLTELDLSALQPEQGIDNALADIIPMGPRLTSLALGLWDQMSEPSVAKLLRRCPNLTKLDLSDCYHLRTHTAMVIGRDCTHLVDLNVAHMQIGDGGLTAIAVGCPLLQGINLMCCNVTGTGLTALLKNCPHITSLNVSWNDNLKATAFRAIPTHCPHIEVLRSDATSITLCTIKMIAKVCRKLRCLGVPFALTKAAEEALAASGVYRPGLRVLEGSCYA